MVGEEDPGRSRGPCPLPPGRRTFWRSNSWASRSPYPEQAKDSSDPSESTTSTFQQDRHFPTPLTPRSHHNSKARSCLPPLQPLSITRRNLDEWPKAGSDDVGEWPHPPTPSGSANRGLKLDLSSCQQKHDPTGTLAKKDRIAFFDKECSKVAEHIYLGGDAVARDLDILKKNGITHVLNCVGFVSPEYFKADFVYKTLWLQDSPSEDITSILYDVFDYFEDVREQQGRVLVHCCQGVSRSTSLVIAYLMWREGQSFEDAFQYVKAARGIADPNMGFTCQLLQCQKRVHAIPLSPNSNLRMYRMAPHSSYDPLHLVPKMLSDPSPSALDSRGAFIIHVPSALYVWIGKSCEPVMERDAKAAAFQVVRYERVQGSIITVEEGEEPSDFWDIFANMTVSVNKSSLVKNEQVESPSRVDVGRRKVDLYDVDFELFRKAVMGGIVPPFSSLAGHGHEMQLPARESNWSILRRKFGSGVVKEWVSASRAALSKVCSESVLMVDGDKSVNKILSPPGSVASGLRVDTKSRTDSPSLSSSIASASTPSVVSSTSSVSLSKSAHSITMNKESCQDAPAFNLCSKTVSSPSKGNHISLSERRGGFSSCLKLPTVLNKIPPSLTRSVETEKGSRNPKENGDVLDFLKEAEKTDSDLISTDGTFGLLQGSQDASEGFGSSTSNSDVSKSTNLFVYRWPSLEKIVNFSVRDLDSKAMLIILASERGEEKSRKLYLWIGSSFHLQNTTVEVGSGGVEVTEHNWYSIGCDFLISMGLPKDVPIKVVKEDEEKPQDFMKILNLTEVS